MIIFIAYTASQFETMPIVNLLVRSTVVCSTQLQWLHHSINTEYLQPICRVTLLQFGTNFIKSFVGLPNAVFYTAF